MGIILIVLLILLLIGGLPRWNHSRQWGYAPTGILSLALTVVLILVIINIIPRGF